MKSKQAYFGSLSSNYKHTIDIESFMNQQHSRYCFGKDIGFAEAEKIGFDTSTLSVIGNDIVFGLSRKKISAVDIKTKICKSYTGDIGTDCYQSMYYNQYGLIIVGGWSVNNNNIANKNIYKIEFNDNNQFTKQTLTQLPYSTSSPSVCMINDNDSDKLFICAGCWNRKNLSECHLYSFNNQKWKEM